MLKNFIPLAMLAARVHFNEDGTAEVFGFWYWNPPYLPLSSKDMQNFFFMDLMAGKSSQVTVRGTEDQIRDLFLFTVGNTSPDSGYPFRDRAEAAAAIPKGRGKVFVDLGNPKPDFVPIDVMVEVTEAKFKIIENLKSGVDQIELMLHPDFRVKIF